MVRLYEEKQEVLSHIRALRDWVIEVEHIFDGSWASQAEEISNAEVGQRLDAWLSRLATLVEADGRTEDEHLRLGHLLQVLTHLRPGLVQCYDVEGFPRTNNDLERPIRAIKMHLSPHQWTQELEPLFTPLWQGCSVPRMVAAATGWCRLLAGSLKTSGSCLLAAGSARNP